jgi:hypothetical protein
VKNIPQGLKPDNCLSSANGAAKAAPFQNIDAI